MGVNDLDSAVLYLLDNEDEAYLYPLYEFDVQLDV
jgi:hypothetical protein